MKLLSSKDIMDLNKHFSIVLNLFHINKLRLPLVNATLFFAQTYNPLQNKFIIRRNSLLCVAQEIYGIIESMKRDSLLLYDEPELMLPYQELLLAYYSFYIYYFNELIYSLVQIYKWVQSNSLPATISNTIVIDCFNLLLQKVLNSLPDAVTFYSQFDNPAYTEIINLIKLNSSIETESLLIDNISKSNLLV